uniref:Uncharacterized protein n=1 Tax=Ciona intestinalis TaxID=7719 RepID=H2Y032_CIOIN
MEITVEVNRRFSETTTKKLAVIMNAHLLFMRVFREENSRKSILS